MIDISHLLCFHFFEPVLYKVKEAWPSSQEKPGWFVGFADNVRDAFCYKILLQDKKTVIERSVVRSAEDPEKRN